MPARPGLSSCGLEITTGLRARAVEESCPQCGSAETVGGHGPSFSLTAAPRTEGPQEGRGGRSCPGSASGPEVEPLLCLHRGEGLPGRWSPEQPLWNETALGLLHTPENHTAGVYKGQEFISLLSTKSREGRCSAPVVKVSGSQTPLPAPSRYKPPSSRSLSRVQGATKMWDE